MEAQLKTIFNREVDLITRQGIQTSRNYLRRHEIFSSAQVIYATGSSISAWYAAIHSMAKPHLTQHPPMNQKLIQSLAQIILSLSDEERQSLNHEISKYSVTQEITEIEQKLQEFEQKYHMKSEHFFQQFQSGELEDSIEFFEWNTYYEMLSNPTIKTS